MNILYQKLAETHFKKFDAEKKIRLIKGNAREEVGRLSGLFDLIFLDADKISYSFYFEESIKKLSSGGLLVVDNVLWNGAVLNHDDHKAKVLDEFNRKVKNDDRVDKILLPVRDGVTLIRKK